MALALFAGVISFSVLLSPKAYAWDLSKTTNGVVIMREASDVSTSTYNVYNYFDYKGGDTASAWAGAYYPNSVSSFNKSRQVANLPSGVVGDSIEIPLHPDYKFQLIYISATSGTYDRTFAVLNEPLDIYVTNEVTVSAMPTVTIGSAPTMTVDSTLPVTVESIGTVDAAGLSMLLGSVAIALGIVFGRATRGGVSS